MCMCVCVVGRCYVCRPDNFSRTLLWATVENRDVDLLTSKRMIDLRVFPNCIIVIIRLLS